MLTLLSPDLDQDSTPQITSPLIQTHSLYFSFIYSGMYVHTTQTTYSFIQVCYYSDICTHSFVWVGMTQTYSLYCSFIYKFRYVLSRLSLNAAFLIHGHICAYLVITRQICTVPPRILSEISQLHIPISANKCRLILGK